MRRILTVLLSGLLLAGVAAAQGAGGGGANQTIGQQLRNQGVAGPGYIQTDFLKDLGTQLTDDFGADKSNKLMGNLDSNQPSSDEVLKLMNGQTTNSDIQEMFGVGQSEAPRINESVQQTVEKKDRKMFFGIVIFIACCDFDVSADSDFLKQIAGGKDALSKESFDKLLKGNVSTKTVGECFGLSDKDDQKFMQDILNAVWKSAFVQHPMAQSLGAGQKGGAAMGGFDPKMFPTLGEGMPGFGGDFAGGEAGGLPFDMKLPPCPFMGENLDKILPSCPKPEGGDTGGTEGGTDTGTTETSGG